MLELLKEKLEGIVAGNEEICNALEKFGPGETSDYKEGFEEGQAYGESLVASMVLGFIERMKKD